MRTGTGVGIAVVFALSLLSCHKHVLLEAPPPGADPATRLAAWETLRADTLKQTVYIQNNSYVGTTTDYLQLAGGQRVYHPEDLLPVVPPGGPTALAVDEYSTNETIRWSIIGGGSGLSALGVGLFAADLSRDRSYDEPTFGPLFYAGTGIMLAGAAAIALSYIWASDASDSAATAFQTYNDSVSKTLDLCRIQGEVRPCPNAATPPPGNTD